MVALMGGESKLGSIEDKDGDPVGDGRFDIVSEDNNMIIHHKVAAFVVLSFPNKMHS